MAPEAATATALWAISAVSDDLPIFGFINSQTNGRRLEEHHSNLFPMASAITVSCLRTRFRFPFITPPELTCPDMLWDKRPAFRRLIASDTTAHASVHSTGDGTFPFDSERSASQIPAGLMMHARGCGSGLMHAGGCGTGTAFFSQYSPLSVEH